jgi:nitroreductase
MDIAEAIRQRKSIRDFQSSPVSKEILKEILELATRTPSAMNTQPWEFVVVGGKVLDNIRQANIENLRSGKLPQSEHCVVGWTRDSIYRERQVELAKELFRLMNISREDREKRQEWTERGFRYFNAPAAIILLTDRSLEESAPLLDLGAVMQTITLAAIHYGLGTCIEDQGVMYPEVLRQYLNIPDSKRIVIAIAIGYPNEEFAANRLHSQREPIEKISLWHGF